MWNGSTNARKHQVALILPVIFVDKTIGDMDQGYLDLDVYYFEQ